MLQCGGASASTSQQCEITLALWFSPDACMCVCVVLVDVFHSHITQAREKGNAGDFLLHKPSEAASRMLMPGPSLLPPHCAPLVSPYHHRCLRRSRDISHTSRWNGGLEPSPHWDTDDVFYHLHGISDLICHWDRVPRTSQSPGSFFPFHTPLREEQSHRIHQPRQIYTPRANQQSRVRAGDPTSPGCFWKDTFSPCWRD